MNNLDSVELFYAPKEVMQFMKIMEKVYLKGNLQIIQYQIFLPSPSS